VRSHTEGVSRSPQPWLGMVSRSRVQGHFAACAAILLERDSAHGMKKILHPLTVNEGSLMF
jgi:hypothetical protein